MIQRVAQKTIFLSQKTSGVIRKGDNKNVIIFNKLSWTKNF